METPDTVRVDENVGRPRRRISSILKAPRTSVRVSDPEQEQPQVEVAKPVEKRNSRRVSFAPANDVLLFSKDMKTVSPAGSPLQALSASTAENVDKRFKAGITEDGTRPITGMETLLSAPLHASQQRNKENFMVGCNAPDDHRERTVMFTGDDSASMDLTRSRTKICVSDAQLRSVLPGRNCVGHNTREDFGEKTVMFSEDDTGSMDMTHSNTILIANYSESDAILPDQNRDRSTCGNLDFMFSLEKRKAEICVPAKNTSSSALGLDPDFADFLASISKPSGTRANPVMTNVASGAAPSPQDKIDGKEFFAQLNARRSAMDKENQAPTFTSKVMEKPQSEIRKTISSVTSSNRSVVFLEDNDGMDMTEALTGHIVGSTSTDEPLQGLFPTPELYELYGHRRRTEVTLGQQSTEVQACTVSDPDDVEITKSHTVAIDSKLRGMELPLSKTRSRLDQSLTPVPPITKNHMISQVFHNAEGTLCQGERTRYDASESDDMELTRSQTVAIDTKSLHTVNPLQNTKRKGLAFRVPPNKASDVSVEECDMDMTKALTVSIDHISHSAGSRMSANPLDSLFPQTHHKIESSFKQRQLNQTELNSEDMELTRSQTVAIDTKSLHTVNPLQNKKQKSLSFMAASNQASDVSVEECGMELTKALTVSIDHISHSAGSRMSANPLDSLFPQTHHKIESLPQANSDDMELTRSQTVAIDTESLHTVNPLQNTKRKSLAFTTAGGPISFLGSNRTLLSEDDNGMEKTFCQGDRIRYNTSESDNMEMTRSQTVAIDTESLHTVNPLQNTKRKGLAFRVPPNKASDVSVEECDMDMTKALTVSIDHISHSAGSRMSANPLDSLFPQTNHKIESSFKQRQLNQTELNSDDMEFTRSQTVAIDTKSLHTVNPLQNKKQKSLSFMAASNKAGDVSVEECDMDMTKALTVSIDHISHSAGSRMSANPLDSLFPQTHHKIESLPKANFDTMEFPRSQAMIIEGRTLDVMKPSLITGSRGPADILGPNRRRISEDDNGMHQILRQGEGTSYGAHRTEPEDMEMTRSQTVAIDTKSLHIVRPSQSANRKGLGFVAAGGAVDILGSNKTLLSERDNGIEMTKTTATAEPVSQNVSHPSQRGQAMAEVTTFSRGTAVEQGNLSDKGGLKNDEKFIIDSGDMDLTRSQTVVIESEIPSMGHQGFPFKTRKSLSFQRERTATLRDLTPLSGLSFSPKTDLSISEDMELTRSQTVAIESKHIDVADETPFKKSGNLDNFPQANAPFEDLSRASLSQAHSAESQVADCRDNVLKGSTDQGDIERTRVKSMPNQTNHETFSRSVLAEDHEMTLTKALTMDIEQLDTARDAVISSQLPEVQCRATTTVYLPDSLDSKEIDNRKDPELTHESSSKTRPAADQVDNSSSRTAETRRMSLADLQSKLKRVSCMINEPTETFALDSCTEPLSKVEKTLDKMAMKTKSLPAGDHGVMGITDKADIDVQSDHLTEEEQPSVTAPLNVKSKGLITRLSMGCFMPKLPQRYKPVELNQVESSKLNSVGERRKTNTVGFTHELSSNKLMDNIEDEVLPNISSDEDLSETMDTKSPQGTEGRAIPHQGHDVDVLEDNVFYEESYPSAAQSKKRPFPEDCHEDTMEDEKRRKRTVDSIQEMGLPSQIGTCSITAASRKTTDNSNSSNTPNLRCEATFESTFQQSVVQSQLEDTNDYTDDVGKKFEDESITVSEFFKLFNIDFLIHNPRQSTLYSLATDVDLKPEDLLRDRHITLPKQRVYETDCQSLTEKVDGLKIRMKDQENLLKDVNRPLWEAVKTCSEKEMKCFGAKLKERSNFFRRTSKALSHEMKEGLYTNLLHSSVEEQQKLRGKIEKTDEVLKSLDDCIHELEAEIAAVEGTGQEDIGPTLKSRQRELENVNKDLADKERQKCEVDEQKGHNVDQMNRLRNETRDLEKHITMLNRVIEWKFVEKKANSTVYAFLYETLRLEVVFDKSDGDDASDVSERNISDITFQLSLDDEAECHAHLVHKLLSQYIDEGGSWVKKYPTSVYVPKLLHDVGLVVSRCRLLGEEVHLMKKWGALRLDILDIRCVDTQVRILFSSLKAFAKFELTIGVTSSYPYCLPQVQNFHSYIGNTTIHQLEEIVFSVTPAKNYLTKIVKRIHETLLS